MDINRLKNALLPSRREFFFDVIAFLILWLIFFKVKLIVLIPAFLIFYFSGVVCRLWIIPLIGKDINKDKRDKKDKKTSKKYNDKDLV